MLAKLKIEKLSAERQDHIHDQEASWNEAEGDYDDPRGDEMDKLGSQILDLIKEDHKNLPFDFIIEELTKLGAAPNILYDDAGHFAISGEGFQNVVEDGPEDVQLTCWVDKKDWKNSLREALESYLKEYHYPYYG